ncbi:MAG: putative lipid II flippase FtsW [Oscillospiraceae bacterium]|nr:putative lipid II flippase FtsW [Oscillospiraceae bacterium]
MEYSENRLLDLSYAHRPKKGKVDTPFAVLTLLLLAIGVMMVLSASFARAYYDPDKKATYYFTRQLCFALSGCGIMYLASLIPISFFRRWAFPSLACALALLLLVLVAGTEANGAKRWFSIAGVSFQPSEIAKLAVILFDAQLICKYKGKMHSFAYGVFPFALVAVLVVGLLILEPHLSASIIILGVTAALMFMGGTSLKWFVVLGSVAVAALAIMAFGMDYSSDRISAWLDPFADSSDTGYQIVQSLYSIGSGGLSGLGLGQSRQKNLYLPEEHNDFIFAVVCEELGFIGACAILVLFALLILRGFWLAMHCRDRYSFLVCGGISSLLAIQVILNVAVVTNLVPCTGISLPFFSYGGTALWLQLGEMGIILSASRRVNEKINKGSK